MPATAKKNEAPKAKTVPITNIQKIGVLRFHGDNDPKNPLGQYIEIKAMFREFFRDMVGTATPDETAEMTKHLMELIQASKALEVIAMGQQ